MNGFMNGIWVAEIFLGARVKNGAKKKVGHLLKTDGPIGAYNQLADDNIPARHNSCTRNRKIPKPSIDSNS